VRSTNYIVAEKKATLEPPHHHHHHHHVLAAEPANGPTLPVSMGALGNGGSAGSLSAMGPGAGSRRK
jgi:hypothetical protein